MGSLGKGMGWRRTDFLNASVLLLLRLELLTGGYEFLKVGLEGLIGLGEGLEA